MSFCSECEGRNCRGAEVGEAGAEEALGVHDEDDQHKEQGGEAEGVGDGGVGEQQAQDGPRRTAEQTHIGEEEAPPDGGGDGEGGQTEEEEGHSVGPHSARRGRGFHQINHSFIRLLRLKHHFIIKHVQALTLRLKMTKIVGCFESST